MTAVAVIGAPRPPRLVVCRRPTRTSPIGLCNAFPSTGRQACGRWPARPLPPSWIADGTSILDGQRQDAADARLHPGFLLWGQRRVEVTGAGLVRSMPTRRLARFCRPAPSEQAEYTRT